MNREIVPTLKKIIKNSTKEALSFDDNKVRPQHILLAIINHGDNKCLDVLTTMNVGYLDLYDAIDAYTRNQDLTPKMTGMVHKFKLPKDYCEKTKKILKSVDRESEKLNDIDNNAYI